jgi:hypothetical protein
LIVALRAAHVGAVAGADADFLAFLESGPKQSAQAVPAKKK